MSVKLLALAASTREQSLNKRLLALAVVQAKNAGAEVTVLDYADFHAPLYLGESKTDLPRGAQLLADALRAHDGLMLASPEYNWSIPGALKNLIDWLSTDPKSPLLGRTGLLLCASPSSRGGISGLQHLRVPLELLGMWVYPQMIGVGDAVTQIEETQLRREKDQKHLAACVTDFVRATNALTSHENR